MNRRTYELLARWIADQEGIKIEFEDDCCPQVEMNSKVITLPGNIREEDALGSLAALMHEAGHLEITSKIDLRGIIESKLDQEILNVLEDIRVDLHNFQRLPNVRTFYKQRIAKSFKLIKKDDFLKKELIVRVFCKMIERGEKFQGFPDPEADKFINDCGLMQDVQDWQYVQSSYYSDKEELYSTNERKKIIKSVKEKVKSLLFPPKAPPPAPKGRKKDEDGKQQQEKTPQKGNGSGCDPKDDSSDEKEEREEPDDSREGTEPDNATSEQEDETAQEINEEMKGLFPTLESYKPDKEGMKKRDLPDAAVRELTKDEFKRLLNKKYKKIVDYGRMLNTKALHNYALGNFEKLFIDRKIIHKKKSKIVFLLDASGSMSGGKKEILIRAVKPIIKTVDEVRKGEGIDVEWCVIGFCEKAERFQNSTWEQEFMQMSGGTFITGAIKAGIKEINAGDITGSRILVLATDGEVGADDIKTAQNLLLREDTKAVILGIQTNPFSPFSRNIVKDNIIWTEKDADQVILSAVRSVY